MSGQNDPSIPDLDLDVETLPSRPPVTDPIARLGRYEILGRMAIGGMAEIFLARERAGDATRLVVVKLVKKSLADDPKFVSMFMSEARLAMRLTHPSICHLYEFGQVGSRYFLAMEYIEGMPLTSLLKRHGALDPAVAAIIGLRVAEALEYAHDAKDPSGKPLSIVHRDVSPHNVMVSFNGVVKLLDFGIAKVESATSTTNAGQVKGKFSYMSPEQARGEALDGRSDVFSLGIVLFELLSAKRLFKRESNFLAMNAIVNEPIPSLRDAAPQVPEELVAIVDRALARDRAERWQNAGDMHEALEEFLVSRREKMSTRRLAAMMRETFAKEMSSGPRLEVDENVSGSFSAVVLAERSNPVPEMPVEASNSALDVSPLLLPHVESRPEEVEPERPSRVGLVVGLLAFGVVAGIAAYAFTQLGSDPGDTDARPVVAQPPVDVAPEAPSEPGAVGEEATGDEEDEAAVVPDEVALDPLVIDPTTEEETATAAIEQTTEMTGVTAPVGRRRVGARMTQAQSHAGTATDMGTAMRRGGRIYFDDPGF